MTKDVQVGLLDHVEPLLPHHVRDLRLSWWSHFDSRYLADHLHRFPGVSFRIRGENQFIVGGFWRGRPEIGLIVEVVGSKSRTELVRREVERFRELNCSAVVLSSDEAGRNTKWFLQEGWQVLDEVVVYTRQCRPVDIGLLEPSRLIRPFRADDIEELLDLEREAFPFLWWSGKEDFLRYVETSEVSAFVLRVNDRMAGYASFSLRNRQGYLDRLAIRPAFQGKGCGSQLLSLALQTLEQMGARAVSLNTQMTNHRAQQLYQKHGFTRTKNDERIYGLWLKRQKEPSLPESI